MSTIEAIFQVNQKGIKTKHIYCYQFLARFVFPSDPRQRQIEINFIFVRIIVVRVSNIEISMSLYIFFLNLLILSNFPLLWLFQNNLAIIHSIIINIICTIENHKYKYNPLCSNSSIFFISFVLITFFHLHRWLADSAQANVCFSSRQIVVCETAEATASRMIKLCSRNV